MTAPAKAAPMREDVTLADAPVGLFWCGETLALKTEYGNNEGRIDAYIVSSGEFFWGHAPQSIASQRATLVTPIDDEAAHTRLAHTARPDAGDGTWGPVTEWEMIDRLRDEEADSVTVLCDNPEGPPNNAVECCGFWTGFADRRFDGATIREALTAAVAAKDEASKVGYPPMSRPDAGDEDVERVARALCVAEELDPDGPHPEDAAEGRTDGFPLWMFYAHAARAALAAMCEGVGRGMVEREALENAINRMGWDEIHAFQNELRKGQDIYEDAGGFFMRAIKALFGIKPTDTVTTYQDAARALVTAALSLEQPR